VVHSKFSAELSIALMADFAHDMACNT